jgi:hypothetical protein
MQSRGNGLVSEGGITLTRPDTPPSIISNVWLRDNGHCRAAHFDAALFSCLEPQ